ncbi:MAG TPA: hypothetical protein DD670_10980, partial [Planctomycetaceae bacterium]|nr:hypothetical protein [Planctomycetaceae bacterium]
MNRRKVILLILFLTPSLLRAEATKVPFPRALEAAAISVPRLDDIHECALIVGNGDINALVYQEGNQLLIRITKNDVWDARLPTENDPPLPTLKRLKELGGSGEWPNKGWIVPEGYRFRGRDSYHAFPYPCPRACAVVEIVLPDSGSMKGGADSATAVPPLSARLDLTRACAEVFDGRSKEPIVTIRALAGLNALLIGTRYEARLKPVLSDDLPAATSGAEGDTTWIHQAIPGDLDWPGMDFAAALAQGDGHKTIAVVTSRESQQTRADAVALTEKTRAAQPKKLIGSHEDAWREFWSASGISIDNEVLQDAWYRNLYFLRCVSKPGVICPGLFAGLVDDKPAWHGDYHTNYNVQQNFWGCLAANHVELMEPYERLINEYLPRGKWLARQMYDCGGAQYSLTMFSYEPPYPERCRSRNGRQFIHHVWSMTLGLGSFAVQPLWWSYKYQPDRERLEKWVYPPLREAALFGLDFMDTCDRDKGGKVVLGPTISPEHWGWTDGFKRNRNCTFDIAVFRFTFQAFLEATEILDRDHDLARRCREYLKRLPDYPVNTTLRDRPFVVDVQDAPPVVYNVAVPAVPVFPGDLVTFLSLSDEIRLFRDTVEGVQWNGNNSLIILGVARARLGMSGTDRWLLDEFHKRLRPNGTLRFNPQKDHAYNKFGHYV